MDNLRDIIQGLSKESSVELYSKIGEVTAVDKKAGTVDLDPIDGSAPILKARLSPDLQTNTGIIQVPRVGSNVIITFLSPVRAFVSLVTDPEEIIINGGGKKGLIIWDELKSQLDANSAILQSLINAIKTPVTEPGNGAPSAFQAKLLGAVGPKTPGQFNEDKILNKKVTHG